MNGDGQRGEDCLTTLLSDAVGLLVFGSLLILLLLWVFNR